MIQSFDSEVAAKYGVNAAIILQLLQSWIAHNRANEKNQHEGRTWTYNSLNAWSKLVPYLTPKQIRTAIDELVSAGLIVKGNFNVNCYDRTCWYALSEPDPVICPVGQIETPAEANENATAGKTVVQDINQSITNPPEVNQEGERFVEWFIQLLKRTGAPEPRMSPTIRTGWIDAYDKLKRLDGKTALEITKVCEWARADGFWKTNFYAPTKLRERIDGISRYDQFLDKLHNANTPNRKPNSRAYAQTDDYSSVF